MTLANITEGEVITARVYKFWGGYLWANNYEIQAVNNILNPPFALQALADRLVALERVLHLVDVTIDRVTISTYAPDSQPYNPDTLATFPYNQYGQRNYSGDALPLDACLFIRRNTDFGRDGRLFYRGCLSENDVGTRGFRGVLTNSTITSIRNIISNWYQTGLGTQWRFVMASGVPDPTNIRPVIGLDPSEKVVYKKLNNRYFRRRP
jgi:hypothetical protein